VCLQGHYDFGMRALKAVLTMAGGRKRCCKQDPETVVVIQALRDANVPKLLTDVSTDST
jgi:dynein heavy chain